MDPKFDALMMRNFHGEVLGDPDLAGVFDDISQALSPAKFRGNIYWHSTDKSGIKFIQKMLGVPQTGVYDDALFEAVKAFQTSQMGDNLPTGVIDAKTWNAIASSTKSQRTAQTGSDILAIGGSIFDALRQPAVAPTVPETVTEPETNWLLYGGLAIGAVVLVGGIILLTRD